MRVSTYALGAALALPVLLAPPPVAAQEAAGVPASGAAVVFLRSQDLLQQAPGSAEAQRTFQQELDEMRTELQAQAARVDSLVADYQRQEVLLSPQAKEQRQQEIRDLQAEVNTRRVELNQRAAQRQQELLQPILDRVGGVIEEMREERGWQIVLDASAEGVVAADPSLDITDLVLQQLQQLGAAEGGDASGR